jgi:O-antigen ligase
LLGDVGAGFMCVCDVSVGVWIVFVVACLRAGGFASFIVYAVVVFVVGGAVSFLDVCQKTSVGDLILLMRF